MRHTDMVKVQFVDPEARKFGLPKYAYSSDAGVDLVTVLPIDERQHGRTVYPGERALLPTGIRIEMPDEYWGSIQHRSSTEKKFRLRVVQGTIDPNYRGDIYIHVHNPNTYPITIHHGDRIAQLIFIKRTFMNFEEVDKLSESERGTNGFGSSGHRTTIGAIGNGPAITV